MAAAGIDLTVQVGYAMTLNATLSSDPDGDTLTYSWTKVSGPAVTLTGASTARPTFTPTEAGTYAFSINVTDGRGGSDTDEVTIVVQAARPIAQPFPLWLVGVILIAAVLLFLVLLLALRKKRKLMEEEAPASEEEGVSEDRTGQGKDTPSEEEQAESVAEEELARGGEKT